jgi:hypothetical protein
MTTKAKLTKAGISTLRVVAAAGGTLNGWAGQKGFYTLSVDKLIRDGYLSDVPDCDNCAAYRRGETPTRNCEAPLTFQGNDRESCYNRVRITDTGREAIASAS